jgi:dihydrodipicolinate synthase/N-acetylneuraminate lyase
MQINWQGVFPAATTHFHADQSLDLANTLQHNAAMIEAGIQGLVMLGTVGENCSLTYDEKLAVLRATVEQVNGRVFIGDKESHAKTPRRQEKKPLRLCAFA